MTRKQALTDMLAKVEAGEFDARTYPLMKLPQMSMDVFDGIHAAYNGSLDAAKALDKALDLGQYLSSDDALEILCSEMGARKWLTKIIKRLLEKEGR